MNLDARCNVWLMNAAGTVTVGAVKFDSLFIVLDVESYDTLIMSCDPETKAFSGISYDAMTDMRLVVERAGANVPTMRTEGVFFIRGTDDYTNSLQITAYSGEELLARRIVAYDAGSTNADMTDQADNMMKRIVRDNLGSSATDTTRILSDLTVDADATLGPSLTRAFARQNVLEIIQGIQENSRAAGSEVFFRMLPTSTGGWQFSTYIGRIGSDRRDLQMNLSQVNENFQLERAAFDATMEINSMYAGGQGIEDQRIIGTASDTARSSISPYNLREAFFNAALESTQAGADDAAEQELNKRRARRVFAGTIIERENYRYGVEWDFGDLLRAEHRGQTYDVMVRKVLIMINSMGESVTARVEVED